MSAPRAFAIFAHPDDIEFLAAGTLIRLREAGWETHYMTLSSGDCGSTVFTPQQTAEIRGKEGRTAAALLGAKFHGAPGRDLQILYQLDLLRWLAAVIREVNPRIILTHSPEDYMEDHQNTSRLTVTAAFARCIPNFGTHPPSEAVSGDVTLYHAMPHGLRDPLRRLVIPGAFVDTTSCHDRKREALAAHASQKDWLDQTQGLGNYLNTLDDLSLQVGRLSGVFRHAEGWRRHSHLGFSSRDEDPLAQALGPHLLVNQAYEDAINRGFFPTAEPTA
jgi:LmbE family N-acetylglucosaminyl deacetylase